MLGTAWRSSDNHNPAVMKEVSQPAPSSAKADTQEQLDGGSSTSPPSTAPPATKGDSAIEPCANTAAVQPTPLQTPTEAAVTAVPRNHNGRERDSSWLELEACREHLRQTCPRKAEECRFAHPEPGIFVKDGRVTCCYDFLKDRCFREKCRYFHPPAHIKERLVCAGKQFGAMMSNYYIVPGGHHSQYTAASPNTSFTHVSRGAVPLISPLIYGSQSRFLSAAPPGFIPKATYGGGGGGGGTKRIEICPYYSQGSCSNPLCPLIHPAPHVRLNMDSTVTVCRDYIRGGCSRDSCRYFHPPANILAQMNSSAIPAMVKQGIVIASPVLPVYPPVIYGPGTPTLPAPVGVPLYPSVPGTVAGAVPGAIPVPVPVVLPPPPPPQTTITALSTSPISTISSPIEATPCHPEVTARIMIAPEMVMI